jgi:hypothetical protein
MVHYTKSQHKKDKEKSDLKEKWMQHAIQIFTEGHNSSSTPPSLQQVLTQAQRECFEQDKKTVKLSKSTLQRRVRSGQSRRAAHEHESWLAKEEAELVVSFAIECTDRGFPLSHWRLKEHVDELAQAHWGNKFPETGVGQQWTREFVSDHSDRLGMYWSRALDKSRARAVNATNKAEYFDLLERVIEGKGGDDRIPAELIYGADKSGFQLGIGQRECVIGAHGKKTQHQQCSGNRENITTLVTICGDRTTILPAIIFKGDGFQVNWVQDNPLNAS